MVLVSRRRSRTISAASRKLAGSLIVSSSRRFFIREHWEQKLNRFNFSMARLDGRGYSRMASRLSRIKLLFLNHFRFRFAAHAHYLKVDRKKIENKSSDGLTF